MAAENIELISFLALGCVFTLTKIDIYPVSENHNTSNKVKLYLEDMSQKELESYPLSKSLLLFHFYSGHPSIQWMNSVIFRQMQIIFIERSLFSSLKHGNFLAHNFLKQSDD